MANTKPVSRMSFSIEELAKSSRCDTTEYSLQSFQNDVLIKPNVYPFEINNDQRKRKRSYESDDSGAASIDTHHRDSASPGNSDDDSDHAAKKSRTNFTNSQLIELESYYRINKYLQIEDRPVLAKKLKLTETQIKWWFQNRRMKEKRKLKSCGVEDLSQFVGVGKRPALNINTDSELSCNSYQQFPGQPMFNPFLLGYGSPALYSAYSGSDYFSSFPRFGSDNFTTKPVSPY